MSKKSGFLCAALLAVMLAGAGIAGCGPVSAGGSDSVSTGGSDSVGTGSESASEDKAPVLRMNAPAMAVPCGKPAELPEATATDEEDGDLTERICVEVTDTATGERVYPAANAEEDILLKDAEWIPADAGVYTVTYFVSDSSGNIAEGSFEAEALNAGQNAIAAKADWLTRNAAFDDDGWLEIGKPAEGETINELPGTTYSGRRIGAGDVVTFTFNSAYLDGGVSSWYMAFGLTPGYRTEEPSILSDTGAPCILEIQQNKLYIRNGTAVTEFTDTLLDGEDHTLSAKFEVTESRVVYSLWIDIDSSQTPSGSMILYKDALDSAGTSYDENLFDAEAFGGYFTLLGRRNNTSSAEDSMTVKAFTVNGEAQIEKPIIRVDDPAYAWYLDQEAEFPVATARDGTFGTDLSDKVEVILIDAEGNAETVDGPYRFEKTGLYTLKYRVADDYGNISVKTFVISCAPEQTEEPPVLTLEGYEDGDILEGKAMQTFVLPAVSECKDANGEDISSRLSVSVEGPVSVSGAAESFVPYAAGTYKIVYSVDDYTGKNTTVTLTLEVAAAEGTDGNQALKNGDAFVLNQTASLTSDGIALSGDGSFVYTGQMIYEEKVSLLLDWTIASSHDSSALGGVWDGAFLTMINMRGGSSLGGIPASADGWPNGFIILIDPYDNLTIQPAGHQTGILARLNFENLRDRFYGKDVLLEFQITDILQEDGSPDYYRIQLWLDGVRVGSEELPWSWTTQSDSEGNFVIRSRQASAYPNLTKAGWLKVTTYCGDDQTGRKNIVKWLSVDGEYIQTKVNVSGEQTEVSVTETYTLPEVELLFDGRPMPLTRTLYIGDSADGRVLGENETELEITSAYLAGFRIEYSYDGVVYHTTAVTVSAAVENVVWSASTEGISTQTANAYSLPTVTSAEILGEKVEDGFVYRVAYASGYTTEEFSAAELARYSPILPVNYEVIAYNLGQEIGRYAVNNVSGVGDLAGEAFTDGDKFKIFYTGELLWENTVTMNITITGAFDVLFLPVRGSVEYIENGSTADTWLSGICFRFYGSEIQLLRDIDKTSYATYRLPASFTAQGDHMISYSVVNNRNEDGEIISISVTLWLDGVLIEAASGSGTVTVSVANIEAFGGMQPAPLWGKQYSYIRINSMYINDPDGTKVMPVYRTNIAEGNAYEVLAGTEFTLPYLEKISGQSVERATVTLNGEPVQGETVAFDEEGTFTLVYVLDGESVRQISVTVSEPSEEPVFTFTGEDGASDSVEREINKTIDIPFTYGYGDTDLTAEVRVRLRYGNYTREMSCEEYLTYVHNVRQNFTIEYLYMGEILATKEVVVTGAKQGNVVTEATNKTGGTEADGVWSGTISPAYLAENMHDYTASVKFRLDTFGYVAIGLRGEAAVNPTYGYDWPANARFALDSGRIYVYLGGSQPVASTQIDAVWNESLEGTDVIFTIQVCDEFENGEFIGTAVKFWINGTLIQLDDPNMHKGGTLSDGNTMFVAATRTDVVWEVWNAPLNFGMFRTTAVWTIREVYFDGTIATA